MMIMILMILMMMMTQLVQVLLYHGAGWLARYIRGLIHREIKQTMKITSVFGPTHQYQLILRRSGATEIRRRINLLLKNKSIPVTFALSFKKILKISTQSMR